MRAPTRPPLARGIALELARWRALNYRDVSYALQARLSAGAASVRGALRVGVTLPRRAPDLILDWRPAARHAAIGEVRVNGARIARMLDREHLVVPRRHVRAGRNRVELDFESPLAVAGTALTRYLDREDGAEYVYTLFAPADASSVFPCFDQPDLRGRFRLELELPPGWRAVSNAPALEEAAAAVRFAETGPIPTYLFAFAAGPFEALTVPGDAARLFVRRSRAGHAREHAAEVLRLNREALACFARYCGHRFPFAKHDLVLLPEFPYGGMEHAGATFLNEERVLFPAPPSAADLLRRAQLVFHEAAHQWFGDLVTMRWFDDLWLKEGFANFMSAKATEALLPQFDARTAFHSLKLAAVRTDATRGTSALHFPLANLTDAKSAYGPVVYSKGPAVLRQLEFYLGARVFRRAVRDLLRRHAWGAADRRDLVRAFERASGRKLSRWAKAWIERRGMPTVRVRDGTLEQRDALGEGGVWPMRLRVWASGRVQDVLLGRKRLKLRLAAGASLVYPNADDYGYGRFLLDARSLEAVLADSSVPGDALLQAQLAEALWEAVREAELAPVRFLEHALAQMPESRDEVVLDAQLGRIAAAFRRYLSDAQRDALAPRIERALLADGALAAGADSRRLLLLRAFAALAWSRAALEDLHRLLDGSLAVPAIALASRDRFRIVQRLLQRGDPRADARLEAQSAADPSDDGRRYAYAARAAAPDAETKRSIFAAFFRDPALPESWIEAALAPLNAPEHCAATRPLLGEALARLPGLKRTRKIFFVNRWLAAFLDGQTDAAALAEVKAFLRRRSLDADSRLKVLEAADGLERAVRIRARYAAR